MLVLLVSLLGISWSDGRQLFFGYNVAHGTHRAHSRPILSDSQVQLFLEQLSSETKNSLPHSFATSDIGFTSQDYSWMPFDLKLEIANGTTTGPSQLVSVGQSQGALLESGTTFVTAHIYLGDLSLQYGYTSFEILGFKYNGSLNLKLHGAKSKLQVNVRRNYIVECKVDLRLEPPQGQLVMLLGPSNQKTLYLFEYLTELYLRRKNLWFSYSTIQTFLGPWAFFRDLQKPLETALLEATTKIVCHK